MDQKKLEPVRFCNCNQMASPHLAFMDQGAKISLQI